MKKLFVLLIMLAAVIFTAGCTDDSKGNSTDTQAIEENNSIVGANESEQNATSQEIQGENGVVKTNESGQNTTSQEAQEGTSVLEVTSLEQINASLEQGPVLVKIGSKHCGPCQAMKPMLKELATEYSGKATIASIDITESPYLNSYFEIGYVPDTSLVVGIEDGDYVYMQENGTVTKDRFQARIQGQMEKEVYENRINLALLKEGKSK
ncbi:thioredoxin [Methanosarcina sp. DH1]|uniref:thioredoxin family protein n=1 Tax=Methanosarcina sp. DH1 TaxID=2605695 RepID=UPI001E33601F|nr:thioredoxin family protein [Methanosarcina sp. DH1]MCC4767650.1 thioredoxin [Methanosarcina sp. DH1]